MPTKKYAKFRGAVHRWSLEIDIQRKFMKIELLIALSSRAIFYSGLVGFLVFWVSFGHIGGEIVIKTKKTPECILMYF